MIKGDFLIFAFVTKKTSFLYTLVNKKNKEKFVNLYLTTDAGILNT